MKVALHFNNNGLCPVADKISNIIILCYEKDKLVCVENRNIKNENINNLSMYLINNEVEEFYVSSFDRKMERFFEHIGISLKNEDDFKKNKLFKSFLF